MIDLKNINKDWTLFLDRDGVINHEGSDTYVNSWEEFHFYEGVQDAFEVFARKFKRIIIVTNQRGVGKGVTKEEQLHRIHKNMEIEIVQHNGRIDAVYFCSSLQDDHSHRKPNPGMGLQAIQDFPDIDLSKAIMVGNRISDMQFGRNLGVNTVYIKTTHPEVADSDKDIIDLSFLSLPDFASALV